MFKTQVLDIFDVICVVYQADHCRLIGKGFNVLEAHPNPTIYRVPPAMDRIPVDLYQLNNRVFLSRNYRLIVATRKFDVLKTNASFKNIKFPRGNYQTDSSET